MDQHFIYHNRQVFFDFQCRENFAAMPAAPGGKYCAGCNKNIVDFTGFTGQEIFTYIQSKPKGTVCGYFKPEQVQEDILIKFEDAYDTLNFTKQFFFVLLFVFGTSLFSIQPAYAQTKPVKKTVENIKGSNTKMKSLAHDVIKTGFESFVEIKPVKCVQEKVVETNPVYGGVPAYDPPPVELINSVEQPAQPEIIYAETMPAFNGGGWRLNQYLAKNIQYPLYALQNKIQGKVYVEFIVETDGTVTKPKVLKTPDESLSSEAIRVLLGMPLWEPATFQGRKVASRYVLPVNFKLQGE